MKNAIDILKSDIMKRFSNELKYIPIKLTSLCLTINLFLSYLKLENINRKLLKTLVVQ